MLIVWRSNFFHYQGKKRRQCKALARLFNEDSEKKNESKSIFIYFPSLRDGELISVRFGQNIFVLGKVVKIALRLSVIRVLPTQDSAKR
jgi:hypothetical protein